jgi:hypothetical protein
MGEQNLEGVRFFAAHEEEGSGESRKKRAAVKAKVSAQSR